MIITRNLSRQGAIVIEGRHRVPSLAKVTLDKWALNRMHGLKIVTKAHKYTFPFYDRYQQKRAYRKIFDILQKQLNRQVPYINSCLVQFMDIGLPTSDLIIFRLKHGTGIHNLNLIQRYVRLLHRQIIREELPIGITIRTAQAYIGGQTDAPGRASGTYENTIELRVALDRISAEKGYFILHNLPSVVKVIETLHRKAIYEIG